MKQWGIEISFNVFKCTYNLVPLKLEKGKKGKFRPCTYNMFDPLRFCVYTLT